MTDSLDIVVREDGTEVIVRNFNSLADSADRVSASVANVKRNLSSLAGVDRVLTDINKFASGAVATINSLNQLEAVTDKVAAAQSRLVRAYAGASLAQEKLRTQQARTQTELAKTEYWLNKAIAAEERAGIASNQLAASQMRASTEAQKFVTAQINSEAALNGAATAAAKATAATAQAATAQQRLATEQGRTAQAAARAQQALLQVATANENLSNAASRAATAETAAQIATVRLTTAETQAAIAAENLSNAQTRAEKSALSLAGAQQRAAGGSASVATQIERLRAQLYPTEVAQEKLNAELARAQALYEAGAINAKMYGDAVRYTNSRIADAKDPTRNYADSMRQVQGASKLTRHELVNLGYQFQDIGVSLASGQKPLTVFIQQGAQIAGIASSAGIGFRQMGVEMLALAGRFYKPLAVVAALAGGLYALQDSLAEDAGLKQYVATLGLTDKEMKKLTDQTITFGDIAKGTFATVSEYAMEMFRAISADFGITDALQAALNSAKPYFNEFAEAALIAIDGASRLIIASFAASYRYVVNLWKNWPAVFSDIWTQAANSAIGQIEDVTNATIRGINKPLELANELLKKTGRGLRFELFDNVSLERNVNENQGAADRILSGYETMFEQAYRESEGFAGRVADTFKQNITDAAKARLAAQAELIKGDRSGAGGPTELEKLEKQLAKVRGQMSPADDAMRKLAQAQDILTRSVKAGLIEQDEAFVIMQRLKEKYQDAIDPIGAIYRAMDQELSLLKLAAPERERANQLMEYENKLLEDNIVLSAEQRAELQARIALTQQAKEVQAAYDNIYSQTIGKQQELVIQEQALQTARASGIISMEQYGIRMSQLAVEAAQLRIQMGTPLDNDAMMASLGSLVDGYTGVLSELTMAWGDFFTTMTDGFADSIGRAIVYSEDLGQSLKNVAQSAVSELISAFVKLGIQYAVNAAIQQSAIATTTASSTAAAATTTTAWAPAATMASIGSFGSAAAIGIAAIVAAMAFAGGFQSGGYTGNMGQSQVAGVVHGQEFVMNAATTKRIGVGNLQALQDGRIDIGGNSASPSAGTSGTGGGNVYINVINNSANSEVNTREEEDGQGNTNLTITIDNIEVAMASRVASGKGPLNKAISSSFGVSNKPNGRV